MIGINIVFVIIRPRCCLYSVSGPWSSNFPANDLLVCLWVCICPVDCEKTAERIWMRFGVVGSMGPGMRQVVGFGDRSTERGNLGGEYGVANGDFAAYLCESA